MKRLAVILKISAAGFIFFWVSLPALSLTIKPAKEVHFIIHTPSKASPAKPFWAKIKAVDAKGRLIRNYARYGNDIIVSPSKGEIQPSYIPASTFHSGVVKIKFTYIGPPGNITFVFKEVLRPSPAGRGIQYHINPFDVLDISVWQAEGLDKQAVVSPDGYIFFPLIGQIKAKGKTLKELADTVKERISAYVINPQVSVSLIKMGGKRVFILGEVGFAGVYNIGEQATLMEAIAKAGGITSDGVYSSIVIMRGDLLKKPIIKIVNLDKVLHGKITPDIYLQPNDVIYVPKKFIASYDYFMRRVFPGLGTTSFLKYKTYRIP